MQSNLYNGVESDKPEGHTLGDRSYEIKNAELFSEVIRVTALPENRRWACSISGIDSVRPITIYWDIYSSLRKVEKDVPLSVIDVERDYLTSEQKRNIELSMVEI